MLFLTKYLMNHFHDCSRNWATQQDPMENARMLYKENSFIFVPDIRDHTANVAEIHYEDGNITDFGWFELISEQFPWVYSKKSTDGVILFTDGKDTGSITLGIKVADCWAITFRYHNKVFWVIHTGWKGVSRGIIESTLSRLKEVIGLDALKETSFQISPMAISGYEFGKRDFETELLPCCIKNDISSENIFHEIWTEGKWELRLYDLITSILKQNGVESLISPPNDTLDVTNPWPSHRLFSKGNESKRGRLLAGISTISL